jgi:hypothetical protein
MADLKIPRKRGRHKASEMYVPLSKFTPQKMKSLDNQTLDGIANAILPKKKKGKKANGYF